MKHRLLATLASAALMLALSLPQPAVAAVEDLPGMDTAADMKEWLKLTDDQVTKLQPVIATRVEKVDAALLKLETAEDPDVMGFIQSYGTIKTEFNTGVTNILTPDQLKQWESFKAELEKSLVEAGAAKQLGKLQPVMKLTDEQVTKLQPAMTVATQQKLDVVQKLADGRRISMRDKLQAKKGIEAANAGLEKAMSAVVSPDQLATYKAAKEAGKKK